MKTFALLALTGAVSAGFDVTPHWTAAQWKTSANSFKTWTHTVAPQGQAIAGSLAKYVQDAGNRSELHSVNILKPLADAFKTKLKYMQGPNCKPDAAMSCLAKGGNMW